MNTGGGFFRYAAPLRNEPVPEGGILPEPGSQDIIDNLQLLSFSFRCKYMLGFNFAHHIFLSKEIFCKRRFLN
jgi:hypothetical protein